MCRVCHYVKCISIVTSVVNFILFPKTERGNFHNNPACDTSGAQAESMREEDLDASLRGAGVGLVELCETFVVVFPGENLLGILSKLPIRVFSISGLVMSHLTASTVFF